MMDDELMESLRMANGTRLNARLIINSNKSQMVAPEMCSRITKN